MKLVEICVFISFYFINNSVLNCREFFDVKESEVRVWI